MTNESPLVTASSLTLDGDMIDTWIGRSQDWIDAHLFSTGTIIQGLIIAVCFMAGMITARTLVPRLARLGDSLRLPPIARETLHKMRGAMTPFFIVIFLFLALLIQNSAGLMLPSYLIDAIMRLTIAWVVIVVAVQVVDNKLVRHGIAWAIWIVAALSIFGVLDNLTTTLDNLSLTLGTMKITALTVIKALISTLVLIYIALGLSQLIERQLGQVPAMAPGSRLLITKIARMTLVFLALMMGITIAGINISALTVFSGAIGLGIGFGLQKGASNLFTGLILLLDKSIQPGDIIELPGGVHGTVRQMGRGARKLFPATINPT